MNQKLHNALAAAVLLLSGATLLAQAPNLGAASSFGLFTAVGAIDNLGATLITGDVGTDAGAFNGLPPAMVVGQIHVADPVSAQVAIDVNLAYTALVTMPCGSVLGTGLGGGQLLMPGVYCIGAAATLNGDLTLDGLSNPNALFVLQIDGALTTGMASQVLLMNGAAACNVFWQINGAVEFGSNSSLSGIVIANGQLSLLDGATLNGKALTIQGAITMSNNAIQTCTPTVLAISLVDFEAQLTPDDRGAKLTWHTSSETNSAYFQIERSSDGTAFAPIARQVAAGNSDRTINYAYTDDAPYTGKNYYRLQSVDANGIATASAVRSIVMAPANRVAESYPNPCGDRLNVHVLRPMGEAAYAWTLIDGMGRSLSSSTLTEERTALDMATVANGLYTQRITCNGRLMQSTRLAVQH